MATNTIWQWEGDQTQAYGSMYWESAEVIYASRVRLSAGRVLFNTGDLEAYYQQVLDREEIIKRNEARLRSGQLGIIGGIEGGYIHGNYPIAGDNLEAVPAEPVYGGTLSLQLKLYGDGVLKFTKQLYTPRVFKMAGGYRAQKWKVVLTGNVDKVQRVDVASSVREIMRLKV